MNKSIIVYGPQGCGKTRHAERIRKHLGLTGKIVDDWRGTLDNKHGFALYLTYDTDLVERARKIGVKAISFAEVANQINGAIPRTGWFEYFDEPKAPGYYDIRAREGSNYNPPQNIWWNGYRWKSAECGVHIELEPGDLWRGLSEEPIIVRGA